MLTRRDQLKQKTMQEDERKERALSKKAANAQGGEAEEAEEEMEEHALAKAAAKQKARKAQRKAKAKAKQAAAKGKGRRKDSEELRMDDAAVCEEENAAADDELYDKNMVTPKKTLFQELDHDADVEMPGGCEPEGANPGRMDDGRAMIYINARTGDEMTLEEHLNTYMPSRHAASRPQKEKPSAVVVDVELPAEARVLPPSKAKGKAKAKATASGSNQAPKASAKGKAKAKAQGKAAAKAKGRKEKAASPFLDNAKAKRRRKALEREVAGEREENLLDDAIKEKLLIMINSLLPKHDNVDGYLRPHCEKFLDHDFADGITLSPYWHRDPNGGFGVCYMPPKEKVAEGTSRVKLNVGYFSFSRGVDQKTNMAVAYCCSTLIAPWLAQEVFHVSTCLHKVECLRYVLGFQFSSLL